MMLGKQENKQKVQKKKMQNFILLIVLLFQLRASALDPTGPFELLNALPVLAPGDTALMIMAFTPTAGRVVSIYFGALMIMAFTPTAGRVMSILGLL